MRHEWLAYVVVALLSIGAGVAIAGLPDNVPVDATIVAPSTTESPTPTVPERSTSTTTSVASTVPEAADTTVARTDPEPTATTEVTTPERGELDVVAANGANVAGAAQRVADRLISLGYADVTPLDGTDIVEFTTVYYADGFEAPAARLAEDLELDDQFVQPLADAPEVPDLPTDASLLVYVGRDRA
jgi:predicted component of type VI protein secretion system